MLQTNSLLSELDSVAVMALFPMSVERIWGYRPKSGVIRENKIFIAVRDGVLIIGRDRSYTHFIPNAKYDDINTDEL